MKKDRNCMYPTYPMPYMGPMNQNYMMPMMGMVPPMGMPNTSNNYPDYNNITNQINSLERRVSNLESLIGNNSNYNNSTYQMM